MHVPGGRLQQECTLVAMHFRKHTKLGCKSYMLSLSITICLISLYAHEHLQMAIEGAIRSPISVMTTPQDTPTEDY